MKSIIKITISFYLLLSFPISAYAQKNENFLSESKVYSYADAADVTSIAPIIVDLQIRKIRKLPESQTIGVPSNIQRVLAEAEVISLLKAPNQIASDIRFLIDIPKDTRGKIPKLKKRRFFAMASPVRRSSNQIRLIAPDAMIPYTLQSNDMVRNITQEIVDINAPQEITGVSSAYYNAGTILGEGETQIFLNTKNNQPFGLSIKSESGARSWSLSTSEIITDVEPAPKRNTLLWYRLACGLPKTLPANAVTSQSEANIAKAQADYKFVINNLGPCGRTR